MAEVEKLLYRVPEVIAATGYSRGFIYEAIRWGRLEVVRKGRTVRVTPEALRNWIDSEEDGE
jgi:excisionase family DNA binding protein